MNKPLPEPLGPPAIVISTGRCGSTLLSQLFLAHPQLLSLSEFFSMSGGGRMLDRGDVSGDAFLTLLQTPQLELEATLAHGPVCELLASHQLSSKATARLPPMLLTTLPHLHQQPEPLFAELAAFLRGAPRAPIASHLRAAFGWLCRRFGRELWVERSGGSAEYASQLLRAFPDARAIFLVRDGVDCALSMASHPLFRMRVAELLGVHGDAAREIPLASFGSYWSAAMQRAWSAFTASSDSLVVRYEDLVRDPPAELGRIGDYLKLDPIRTEAWTTMFEDLPKQTRRPATSVTTEALEQLARSCRPGMRCLARFSECRV